MENLFFSCRQFLFAAAIYDGDVRAESERRTGGIHRNVSSADNHNLFCLKNRRIGIFVESAHKVASRQKFVSGKNAFRRFALDTHKTRQTRAAPDKDSRKTLFFKQIVYRDRFPYNNVLLKTNAETFQFFDFFKNHFFFRQTKFGDSVSQHTPELV